MTEPRYQRLVTLQTEFLEQVNAILGAEEDQQKRYEQWQAVECLVRSLSYQVKCIGLNLRDAMPKEGG